MAIIWCMVPEIPNMTDRLFCHFEPFFPFLPLNNPKNQNFEKMKKLPGDVLILHRCNMNDNHMMYGSWDTKCDRIFCHFGPLSKFWKNEKTPGDIIILQMCTINDNHIICGSWDMKRDRQNFLLFWTIFLLFLPTDKPKNQNFEKLKNELEISPFYTNA